MEKRRAKAKQQASRKEKYQARLQAVRAKRAKRLGLPIPGEDTVPTEGAAQKDDTHEQEKEEETQAPSGETEEQVASHQEQTRPSPLPVTQPKAESKANRFLQKLGQELGI